jgi:hypothetical protein
MSQGAIKITLICDANTEKDIENALINSGIQLTKEEVKKPIEAHVFYIPNLLPVISVALHILEAKKDVIKGDIELSDGTKYELTQEGIAKLNGLLIEALCKKKEDTTTTQIVWWTPFIPEIREGLKAFIELLKWYPKATGEGKKVVTTYFVVLIGLIVLGMGILTFFDKVSGDSFVFVVGALIGYIFAFLQKFLGILSE